MGIPCAMFHVDLVICSIIAAIFNINFSVFYCQLHYDHQVLLDYLISKDIGASCAEYLLRLIIFSLVICYQLLYLEYQDWI